MGYFHKVTRVTIRIVTIPQLRSTILLNMVSKVYFINSSSQDDSRTSQVRDLMAAAFAGPLNPSQQAQVIMEFKADPRLVYHCSLTPQKVQCLSYMITEIKISITINSLC